VRILRRASPWVALAALCMGFTWPGRIYRLRYDLDHGDTARRRDVVRELGGLPAATAEPGLLDALEDDERVVRLEAARAAARVQLLSAVAILRDWLDDPDPDTRATAATALGDIGDASARDGLVRALSDATPEVRRAATAAVATLGGDAAVPALLGALDDPDARVRVGAVEALGRLGDARALVPLAGLVRDDAPDVREAAMRALGQLGDARALPSLEQGFADAKEPVRLAAAGALGQVGGAEAARVLTRVLAGTDTRLARAAVAALGNLDDAPATGALIAALDQEWLRDAATEALWAQADRGPAAAEGVVGALARAITTSNDGPRTNALADALLRVSTTASIVAATRALLAHDPPSENILAALAATGVPEAALPLFERLAASDEAGRDAILRTIEAYFRRVPGDGRAADPLLDALAGATPPQQVVLVRMLQHVRADRSLPALRKLLASERSDLRRAALGAIAAIGDPDGARALGSLLDAGDPGTRSAAADALAASGDASTVAALLDRIARDTAPHPDAVLRAAGALLRRLDDRRATPGGVRSRALDVLARASDHEDRVRADAALDALAVWHPPEAVGVVARALRSPSSRRRALAAAALAAFPVSDARAVLRYVLQRDAPLVVTAAAAALGEIGDQRDLASLAKAARHRRWPVPAAATWAIARMARRGALKEHATSRVLCDLGRSRDPLVRANVAAAMAVWGGAPCAAGGPDPLTWLARAHDAGVREAAAGWVHAATSAGRLDPTAARAALARCAARDVDPGVRTECTSAPEPRTGARTGGQAKFDTRTVDAGQARRDGLVAARLTGGGVFVGLADINSWFRVPGATHTSLALAEPGASALEPAPTPDAPAHDAGTDTAEPSAPERR
jgi:HEAT repeat protein